MNTTNPTAAAPAAPSRANVRYLGSPDKFEERNGLSRAYFIPNSLIEGRSAEEALEVIFAECQHGNPAGSWISNQKVFRTRSLSVGDVVELDGKHYVCEGCGWKEVSKGFADRLVEKVTSRDFWGTVEATVKALKGGDMEQFNALNDGA